MKIVINKCFNSKIFCYVLLSVFFVQFSYSQRISQSVRIRSGAINGVFIENDGAILVIYGDPEDEIPKSDMVLFTHFRRDVIWAGRNLVQNSAQTVAPEGERLFFTKTDSLWTNFAYTRLPDYSCQTKKFGIIPLQVTRFVKGGEILTWKGTEIKVLNTPGYTRGAVSYIADVDNKRFAFVGDLIYGDGKIFDLYSFQDSLGDIRAYHGYASRLGQLISSLQLIAEEKPDFIIPSRGPIIKNPDYAIKKLIQQIHSLYQNYLSISAYRWYYPERMDMLAEHVLDPPVNVVWMPYASVFQKSQPSWLMHFNTSYLIFASDSSAFLIDCGSKRAFENILELKQSGRLKRIVGIFITHYHGDHTNYINDVVNEFHCPVYITKELKDILKNPGNFNMPYGTSDPIRNLTIMQEGEKMHWKDYNLTFHYFPGQTIYHDAILIEKDNGETIFFIGDSFTPSGIDDYCLLNRNLLHTGTGYFYCLDFLKKLPENVLLANQHTVPLFSFSRHQLDYMTDLLYQRRALLKDLFPWDDLNYGLDEQWVRIYPYGQNACPGQILDFSVKVNNHSDVSRTFILEPDLPNGFRVEPKIDSLLIGPLNEGEIRFKLTVPEKVLSGIYLITVNIKFDKWDLQEWTEALIEISP